LECVYLIRSINHSGQRYIGITSDLQQRLKDHNSGKSVHTSKSMPWETVAVVRFDDDERAEAFERYLKSGSGNAFAKKHLW
jgi:putative endonuclease